MNEGAGATAAAERNLKLTVAYDGGGYHGFQRQPGRVGPTVQGMLERRLREITGGAVSLRAAGRTDAGVHALGQVVNFKTGSRIPTEAWVKAMNAGLPRDIRVVAAEEAPAGFHARYDAVSKVYRYLIQTGPVPAVLWRNYAYYVPRPLRVEAMAQGAACLVGRHDFRSFQAAGAKVKTTVRTLSRLEVAVRPLGAGDLLTMEGEARVNDRPPPLSEAVTGPGERDQVPQELISLTLEADGFLYNMVRIIAGLLVDVGLGRRPPEEVSRVLEAKARAEAALTAPPHGLCLVQAKY
jgi:tRNA pseudouridine38-40 synthase